MAPAWTTSWPVYGVSRTLVAGVSAERANRASIVPKGLQARLRQLSQVAMAIPLTRLAVYLLN